MHLSQIAASPMVKDDLAEPGRAAHAASNGEGFESIFSDGAAAGRTDPPETGPRDSGGPIAAEPGGNAKTSGAEATGTVETAKGAPQLRGASLGREENATSDGQSAETIGSDVATDASTESVVPDGWLVPGFAGLVPVSVPGGANSGWAFEGFAQKPVPSGTVPEAAVGDVAKTPGAVAGQLASLVDVAAAGGALTLHAGGAEKSVHPMARLATDVSGNPASGGVLTANPSAAMIDPEAGGPGLLAGMTQEPGTVSRDGTGLLGGSEIRQAETVGSTGESRSARGAVAPAAGGQIAGANGHMVPAEADDLPSAAREPRAEARTAAESLATATQAAPKGEISMVASTASAVASAGPDADTVQTAVAGGSGAPSAGEGLFDADPVVTDPLLADSRGATRGATAGTSPFLQSPDTPRQVALQIAEVVRASGERAVELKLQPEELGRVHLTMSQDATGTLTVSLNVERAETLDLLRRNIDLLRADLQELGYGSIDFSFQGDGAGADQDARPGWGDGAGVREAETATPNHDRLQSGARGGQSSGDGIDIRI